MRISSTSLNSTPSTADSAFGRPISDAVALAGRPPEGVGRVHPPREVARPSTSQKRSNLICSSAPTAPGAHGHEPVLVRGKLGPESRQVLQKIDLHMHDLRRECGSRLLEAGVGIHEVREWLGHKDISTTGRYLVITGASLQRALGRLEEAQRRPHDLARLLGLTATPKAAAQA